MTLILSRRSSQRAASSLLLYSRASSLQSHQRTRDFKRPFSVLSSLWRSNVITANLHTDDERKNWQQQYGLPRISVLSLSTTHNAFSSTTKHPSDTDATNSSSRNETHDMSPPPAAAEQIKQGRMADMRRNMRNRAGSFRDSARQNYQDFREDPRSRTAAGAKSVKAMFRQYGPVFVATYMSVYFSTLGALFLGVESGLLDPAGLFNMLGHVSTEGAAQGETLSTVQIVADFMRNHAWMEPYAHYLEKNPAVANLAVAWIAVKFTEPVRLALSVAITPRIARYFGYVTKKVEAIEGKVEDKLERKLTNEEAELDEKQVR